MNRRTIFTLSTAILPLICLAGPMDDFVKARKKHGIELVSDSIALQNFTGQAVFEVTGQVTGSVTTASGTTALLVKFRTCTMVIDSPLAPEWIEQDYDLGRFIVTAVKERAGTMPDLALVASLPEDVAQELEVRLKVEAERKQLQQQTKSRKTRGSYSRYRGYVPDPLNGPIGKVPDQMAPKLAALVPVYAGYIQRRNKYIEQSEAEEIAQCILAFSAHFGVEPRLIMALVQAESGFKTYATSRVGAQGLGQLMPDTWRSLGIVDPYDIKANIYGTVRTLRGHLERQGKSASDSFDQLALALACYNAGSGAVKKYGGVPPYTETQNYVERVIGTYRRLTDGEL